MMRSPDWLNKSAVLSPNNSMQTENTDIRCWLTAVRAGLRIAAIAP